MNTDLRILNGRTKGDSFGRPTFHGKNGVSVVDYIICNQTIFQNIQHFIVKPPNYLSDQSQIVAWFDILKTSDVDEIIKASETELNTFSKTLKTTSDEIETNSHDTPNEDELLEHFQQLHSPHNLNPEHNHIIENLKSIEKDKDRYNELDAPITENELLNAMKKIKLKKAAYSDRISNEIIKASSDILTKGFIKVFNIVLKSGNFPKAWCEGLITPIFKSGNHLDPNKYRGQGLRFKLSGQTFLSNSQ